MVSAIKLEELFQRYEDLQQYVGWSSEDVVRIRAAVAIVAPHLPEIINDFYAEIARHPQASKVVTGGEAQIRHLKGTLRTWLDQLFAGPYDIEYVARRWRVGMRHVEIGLDQVYTNAALSRIQNGLIRLLRDNWQKEQSELLMTVQSLNKLINLDLAIIEDAYETEHVLYEQRAERARGEATFRNLVETAGCMIVILRADHTIAYFSPYAEQLTGYSAKDVVGHDYFSIFLSEEDRPGKADIIRQVLSGARIRDYQNDVLCLNGTRRATLWNARRLDHYEDQRVCLAVGHDITSLKEAQSKTLQSERLATIGQMSTGLAHESRNALQRIQASAEVLELKVEENGEAMQMVRQIQTAQEHLHQLFDEVQGYAAPVILDCSECQLSTVWREAWKLLTPLRHGRETHFSENTGELDLTCSVDRFRMVQVFRNLLENSLAACSDPVNIGISCTESVHDNQTAIAVTISDNGTGFTPHQRERAFSPFFTTKSKGTGLGMAIAQRIVQAHGGAIAVGDKEGVGAEIHLLIQRTGPGPVGNTSRPLPT